MTRLGDLSRTPAQSLAQSRPSLRSDQVALSLIQSAPDHIQRWKLHQLYGQTVPLVGCPHGRLLCSPEAAFSHSSQGNSSSLPVYMTLTWTSSSLSASSLCWGPHWLQCPRWSNECCMNRDNNGFPQPADCALVKTADPKLQYFCAEAQPVTALSL